MDAEIQFGELEEAQPETRLRPDSNKHYAVVGYELPDETDLPIFVDLDVMRDMETHACEDTSVELGGVLLGGQFEDEDGSPFVVVTDSLRAQHYEATKGSFKFTHETWEQISRERDEFPDELQMVGWYHTHPDWGVFLSGMDMFICDNFFNRPLDLALVIDPCRGDRGMFQWTGDPAERIRRTGGFYIMASRFRIDELECFSSALEGRFTMANDPRFAGRIGASPAPVVNIAESRNPWLGIGVMGMLMMQFFLLSLIAWKLLVSPVDEENKEHANQLVTVETKLDALIRADHMDAKHAAREQMLDDIVARLEGGKPLDEYEALELRARRAEERADSAAESRKELTDVVDRQSYELDSREFRIETLDKSLVSAREKLEKRDTQIAKLETEIKELKASGKSSSDDDNKMKDWVWVSVVSGILVLLVIFGSFAAIAMRNTEEEDEKPEKHSEDQRDAANEEEA